MFAYNTGKVKQIMKKKKKEKYIIHNFFSRINKIAKKL